MPEGLTDQESQAGKTTCRKASQVCALYALTEHVYANETIRRANDPSLYHQNTLDKQLGNYDFFPKTYILPSEYAMFVEVLTFITAFYS